MKFRLSALGMSGRKCGRIAASGIVFAGVGLLFSCEDEIEKEGTLPSSEYIAFMPEISALQEKPAARSGADSLRSRNGSVRELECRDGGTFYLHTLVTDSIAAPAGGKGEGGDRPGTRSFRVPEEDFNRAYGQFSVSAFKYEEEEDFPNTKPDFMYDKLITNGDQSYLFPTSYRWPGSSYKVRFFAYAPDSSKQQEKIYLISGRNETGAPKLTVKVPQSVAQQQDLLVAASGPRKGDGSEGVVPLDFKHALTAVTFKCGRFEEKITIKKATLKSVYTQGIYDMGTETWSGLAGNNVTGQEFTIPINIKVGPGMGGASLLPEQNTLMMIPQTLPPGARLEVEYERTYKVNGTDETKTGKLNASLDGMEWEMGTTVTYILSSDQIGWNYYFGVSIPNIKPGEIATIDMWGGKFDLLLISEKVDLKNNIIEPVPWTLKAFSEDGGQTWTKEPPYWIGTLPLEGPGALAPSGTTFHPVIPSSLPPSPVSEDLKKQPLKGSKDNPYDLSTLGGTEAEQTANCYVVDAPGYYKFPAVYGNAKKNGGSNEPAYRPQQRDPDNTRRLALTFPAYNLYGYAVDDPYVTTIMGNKTYFSIDSAKLIWQDSYNLVDSLQFIDQDRGYITFYVDPMMIREGNAVIGLMGTDKRTGYGNKGNECFWSWHIWVTNQLRVKQDVAYKTTSGKTWQFMPVNLGWTEPYTGSAETRECWIMFTNESGLTSTVKFRQKGGSYASKGENPYYQAGRKDPMFSPDGNSADGDTPARPWFDSEGKRHTAANATYAIDLNVDQTPLAMNNRRPTEIYANRLMENQYMNLWDNNMTVDGWGVGFEEHRPIKTVYDPSPRGYMVPPIYAFSGMENNVHRNGNGFTVGNSGLHFPLMGYRLYNNNDQYTQNKFAQYYGIRGFYWSCDTWNNGTPNPGYHWAIKFNSDLQKEVSTEQYERGQSLSVRPIREPQN